VTHRLLVAAVLLALPAPRSGAVEGSAAAVAPAVSAVDPAGRVRVLGADGRWQEWWARDAAPARWSAPLETVAGAVRWRAAASGVEWGELRLSGPGEAWRVRAVVVRLDPARAPLRLAAKTGADGALHSWSVDDAPADAALALNAGQFTDAGPWGWVVHRGREHRPPGVGPLSSALVVDGAGRARIVDGADLAAARRAGGVAEALQSYPTLLVGDGLVPDALRPGATAIDLAHRDARLAVGELRDGRLLVLLTRFDGLGTTFSGLPLGLTTPETAALLGALGARRALMLDGGLSSQLLVRSGSGTPHRWPGLRRVPLGLVAGGGR
jgi:hypothetical protein